MVNYKRIPPYTKEDIDAWVRQAATPGSFLHAVLTNDLRTACEKADDRNQLALFDIVGYLYNECPMNCWGSVEKVEAWAAMGGLLPRDDEDQVREP